MENRVELCCHTKMSKLQGINDIKEYIDEAINRGYKSIAITDLDSTQSFFIADDYLRLYISKEDFKIIYGAEMHFKISKNDNELYTIYIYVKEQKGLKNLYKLVSKAYKNILNDVPTLYKNELIEYKDGLLYSAIGNKSEVYKCINNSNINEIIKFYDFIGIVPDPNSKNINLKISELCKKENKLLIGTSECNFINKNDFKCNEILNFYKKNSNIEKGNNKYFQTVEELIDDFDYIDNAKEIVIDNTQKVADSIEEIRLIKQRLNYPTIESSKKIINENCYNKAYELYGKKLPKEVKDRLELELNSITKNNYENIYLICSELVQYSNNLGYEVGYRGGVGNSLVAFLLGITNVNPLEYNLPFEIFAGKNYDREPDIDLNFSRKVQPKIFTYLQKKYGKDKIIWGGTIGCLADKTVEICYNEYINTFGINDIHDKDSIVKKTVGTKKITGEHPGGVFIIPENMEITDICPTEIGYKNHLKTHNDYHSVWNLGLYKYDILGHDDPTMIYELEKATNVSSRDIKLNDVETLKLFLHANDSSYSISTKGIPEFDSAYVKKIIEESKPVNFNDLVCISALSHGTGTWTYNASTLIEKRYKKVNEVISNRADLYNYLVSNGIESNTAFDITEFIRKGKASRGRSLWQHTRDRYKELNDKWEEYKKILKEHDIPEWYIQDAEKISYLFQKSHAIIYTINAFKIAWYKVHYPQAFYKAYFKVKSDLNINEYYCKRQVKTELNRLYDLKEIHNNNTELDYDCNTTDKIKDLEIVLEMFNLGILKEKAEIKDDYNLINSRAISDYCRSKKHRFNTEELAVLVYRNKRISVKEKIEKYNDLIKNYPDMEVIERINCEHYDSVKTLIKNEIQRLKILNKKYEQDDENSIYTWTEYNKSTKKYEHRNDLENTFRTYKEVIKDIQNYIKEFDDTISFSITKKYFDKRKKNIRAEYIVKEKNVILINLVEEGNDFLDIEGIFVNMPTPFKKGDILISDSLFGSWKNYNDWDNVFVLDYLCTWRDNLTEMLKRGNYDSSDMIGYGYYLVEDSTEFVRDHKWDYDSFEYYEGEFKGRYRILKGISNFIKEKIGLELFVHTYDLYKTEFKNEMPECYTDEGLQLAGMTDEDINRINHREYKKIYNFSKDIKDEYINHHTCIYEKLERESISQIETDFDDKIFVLCKDGSLYKTKLYDDSVEKIDECIKLIHFLDGQHLYKITSENIILPIENNKEWSNTDLYLNNNSCKYKKIELSSMHIVLLSNDGNVRAVCGGYPNLGIIADNFVNVDDITIVEDENGIDVPYIYKKKEFKKLYID